MLTNLAAWYLSKRKVSVIIGYELKDTELKSLCNKAFIYNNIFTDVDYRTSNDGKFEIPEGKFNECWIEKEQTK